MAANIASYIFYAYVASFFVSGGLLSELLAIFFSWKTNTVAAWVLFVVGIIAQILASVFGLETRWWIALVIIDLIAFVLVVFASIRAAKQFGSCCTTGCSSGKKRGCDSGCGCFSSCCGCGDKKRRKRSKRRDSDSSDSDSDCDDDRRCAPTRPGGTRVKFH